AGRLGATAGESRKRPARALASSKASTSARNAASPAQTPSRYSWRSVAEGSSRAFKNSSFARGFHVVMVVFQSGRDCPYLSMRKTRAACAQKRVGQLFPTTGASALALLLVLDRLVALECQSISPG